MNQEPTATPKKSGTAIAALILAIVSIPIPLLSIIALILSIVSLLQIKKSRGMLKGEGNAIAGIVCSVLGMFLLPAILFPVFMKGREMAKSQICLSNVKQISTAMQMYNQDYDEAFPPRGEWCDQLSIYMRDQKYYVCPKAPKSRSGYAFNAQLDKLPISKLESLAQTIAIFDAKGGWNTSGKIESADHRHPEGAAAYADGHVQWMKK